MPKTVMSITLAAQDQLYTAAAGLMVVPIMRLLTI